MDWFFECNKQPLKETTHTFLIKYLSVANIFKTSFFFSCQNLLDSFNLL